MADPPATAAISPNGRKLYAANFDQRRLLEVDTATDAIVATVAAGANQTAVLAGRDGHTAYVMNRDVRWTVTVVDIASGTVKSTIPVVDADRLAAPPDGSRRQFHARRCHYQRREAESA